MEKWKIKKVFRSIKGYISLAFQLPHFITALFLLLMSIISLILSFNIENSLISSIFSNIFAGLITGIAICFISGLKSMSFNNIDTEIEWLWKIHEECLEYINMHKAIQKMGFDDKGKIYEEIYDLICKAESINTSITQSQFNRSLLFNPENYCLKYLEYEVSKVSKCFIEIYENIKELNDYEITKKKFNELFKDVYFTIYKLNGSIIHRTDGLKKKRNMMRKFII